MIKVGVIGVGSMGQNHARLYAELGCEFVGVSDTNPENGKVIAEKYRTKYYPDYHDLLDKVDAVSIAVPTTLHHSVVMDCLEAGVHCLVEKPIAFTIEESADMIAAADKRRLKLAVGHIERFNPAVIKLKEVIDRGILGQVLIISTRRVGPYVPRIRDVGVVVDSATHDIGVVRYLIGKEPAAVFSRTGRLVHTREDHAVIVLDFDGATACLEVNWFTPHKVRTLTVTGSQGIAYLDYIQQSLVVHNTHPPYNDVSSPLAYNSTLSPQPSTLNPDLCPHKVEPLRTEIEDFLSSIIDNREPAVSGREGRAILKIALESNHSNYCVSPFSELMR